MNADLVRITRDIISPACGDHPNLLVVAKGAIGELMLSDAGTGWPAYVMVETTAGKVEVVGLKLDEFEVVEAAEASR